MGVKQMVVAINKMDDTSVNYSKARYEEIQNELTIFLKKVGYNVANIPFIPSLSTVDEEIKRADLDKSGEEGFLEGKAEEGVEVVAVALPRGVLPLAHLHHHVPDVGLRNRMVAQERLLHMARPSDLILMERAAEAQLLADPAAH